VIVCRVGPGTWDFNVEVIQKALSAGFWHLVCWDASFDLGVVAFSTTGRSIPAQHPFTRWPCSRKHGDANLSLIVFLLENANANCEDKASL
jgi:hypothetical protein